MAGTGRHLLDLIHSCIKTTGVGSVNSMVLFAPIGHGSISTSIMQESNAFALTSQVISSAMAGSSIGTSRVGATGQVQNVTRGGKPRCLARDTCRVGPCRQGNLSYPSMSLNVQRTSLEENTGARGKPHLTSTEALAHHSLKQ